MIKLLSLLCICALANDKVKLEEKKAVISEVEEMFDEFALLKNESRKNAGIKNEVHKPPFSWPVDMKMARHVFMEAPNRVRIDLKAKANITSPHMGVIIAIKEKTITLKHVVEGGVCYFTIFTNVENITLPVGELIKSGTILGQSKSIIFEIRQMNVSIPPSMDMLLPAVNPALVRVISKI